MLVLTIQVVAAWLILAVVLLLAFHRRVIASLWREPVLVHPVVIVESDDWGVGPPEDALVLAKIADLLGSVRDETGHPLVMTIGVVLGFPDGAHILKTGCTEYRRMTLDEPRFAPIVDALRAGCDAGVYALQWHGLEHCWPASLLARARRDIGLMAWLADPGARSETLPSELQSRWVDAAELPSRRLARTDIESAVCEEAALLRRIFGHVPNVAVPNTFVWTDDVEYAWAAAGVRCIVTAGRRCEGRDERGVLLAPSRRVRNGERTASGALQVVRDDYFEPARGHRAERAWDAVTRKSALGRPALLETHRENFIASPEVAADSLAEFERAVRGLRARFPDIRFMPTAELAAHLGDGRSPLREGRLLRRLHIFLRRLQFEPALMRFLKFSGLGLPLRCAVSIARSVKLGRSAVLSR